MTDEKIQNEINTLKERVDKLEGRMDNVEKREWLLINDLNRLLDGTDENPGVIRKLDELIETVKNQNKSS